MNTDSFFAAIFDQIDSNVTAVVSNSTQVEPFKSAKIEDLEFRTETNDFDISKQDYVIRLSPTTKAIRAAEEELYKAYTLKPTDADATLQYKIIEDAYQYWVNEFISNEKEAQYQEWDLVLTDKKSIVEKQLIENNFDLSEYFEVNSEIKDLALRKISNTDHSNLFQSPFEVYNVSFNFEDIISLDQIKAFVNGYNPSENNTTLKEEEYSYEKYLIQKELDLEMAQTKQILRFGQVAFSGPNSDPFKENVSIGAAFRMPWDGGNRLKIHELKLKLNDVNFSQTSELNEIFVDASRAKYELLNLINNHEKMETLRQEQHEDSQKFIEVIANSQGFNPLHALDVKEQSIKSNIESLSSLQKIYESYIKMLKDSQKMFVVPFTNYLLN